MLLTELFASMKKRRRRAAQQSYEDGALITRRLRELLSVPALVQTPPAENDLAPTAKARKG